MTVFIYCAILYSLLDDIVINYVTFVIKGELIMSEIKALKKQVKAEAKAFKRDAEESVSVAEAIGENLLDKKAAKHAYKKEMKELKRTVAAETAAYKSLACR